MLHLAENEKVLKEWDIAKSLDKKKKEYGYHKIVVTDKRIVSETESASKVERVEIKNKDVAKVQTYYDLVGKIAIIIVSAILFALMVGSGIAVLLTTDKGTVQPDMYDSLINLGSIFIIAGVVILLVGILVYFLTRKAQLGLLFVKTTREKTRYALTYNSTDASDVTEAVVKVKVDAKSVKDLAEEISAYLNK